VLLAHGYSQGLQTQQDVNESCARNSPHFAALSSYTVRELSLGMPMVHAHLQSCVLIVLSKICEHALASGLRDGSRLAEVASQLLNASVHRRTVHVDAT
jgi:hypothetical protein